MPKLQEIDTNFEIRKRQLENLKQFICSSLEKTDSIIKFMGWDASKVIEDKGLVQCTVQPSHRMPKSSLPNHLLECIVRQEGYDTKDEFLSEPRSSSASSVYITDDTKLSLFTQAQRNLPGFKCGWRGRGSDPRTADRLSSTFTEDERLVLYDYAVANTESHPPLPEFDVTAPQTEKPLSYEEKLILERNAKRRRTKYKAVHTNKKSYTEIMREVIDGQMKLYEEWYTENTSSYEESRSSERSHSADYHRSSSKRRRDRKEKRESEHPYSRHSQHRN